MLLSPCLATGKVPLTVLQQLARATLCLALPVLVHARTHRQISDTSAQSASFHTICYTNPAHLAQPPTTIDSLSSTDCPPPYPYIPVHPH